MGGHDVARGDRHAYLNLAGDGHVDEAVDLCLDLFDRGVEPETIVLRLLRPAQCELGRLWSFGTWTAARVHAACAAADAALAALGAAAPGSTHGDPVVVACPRTEWHGFAARTATQLLRWRGVPADFVGTLASDAALVQLLRDRRPRILALSCTMTAALPDVARAVVVAGRHGTAVVGGGQGFGPHGRYARSVGVAEWVEDAPALARRIAHGDGTSRPGATTPVPESVAYRRLARHRRELVRAVAARVLGAGPDELDTELGTDDIGLVRDAAEQVVALALAAARTGHGSILGDGVAELAAGLRHRPTPVSAVAARLPTAAREELGFGVRSGCQSGPG